MTNIPVERASPTGKAISQPKSKVIGSIGVVANPNKNIVIRVKYLFLNVNRYKNRIRDIRL